MIKIFKKIPTFNYLKHTKLFVSISVFFAVITLGSLIWQGLNYGFDFRGGSEVQIRFVGEFDKQLISTNVSNALDEPINVINLSSQEILISFAKSQTDIPNTDIKTIFDRELTKLKYKYEILKLDSIGPKIESSIKNNAIYSVLISIMLVLIYMAFRFNFYFGVGAIIALVHDVFLTIGAFSLFQKEFDLTGMAGILTLIGYSLNDTIVVFDRVRENLVRHPGKSLYDLINLSVNETMSRTILTFGTTFTIVITMFIWGGNSISGFSFSFMVGMIVGTYSSVFIASPVALILYKLIAKKESPIVKNLAN